MYVCVDSVNLGVGHSEAHLDPGGYSETENAQSAKICLKFNFWGGYSETENSQSAKICLNFNFRGGGGGGCILKLKSHKVTRSG